MTEKCSGGTALPNEARAVTAAESALGDTPGQALAAAYQETYKAIGGILDALSDGQLATVIPACPAWTVRDLVAHMTGTAADAITARFPLVNAHGPWAERQAVIDAFTAEQVAARKDMTIDEVRGEWAGHVPVLVNMLRGAQPFPPGSIPDHQLDGGLRRRGPQPRPARRPRVTRETVTRPGWPSASGVMSPG